MVHGKSSSLQIFAQLPMLAGFPVRGNWAGHERKLTLPLSALPLLPQVFSLSLHMWRLTTAQLTRALQHFPSLQQLEMFAVHGWGDLTFLHPVRAFLDSLRLVKSEPNSSSDVAPLLWLGNMPQLTSVELGGTYECAQTPTVRKQLRQVMPALHSFVFPDSEEDSE
jgi:hypothetical protein